MGDGSWELAEEICVSRFSKSYVLVVVMRTAPLLVNAIWPTSGELARYV